MHLTRWMLNFTVGLEKSKEPPVLKEMSSAKWSCRKPLKAMRNYIKALHSTSCPTCDIWRIGNSRTDTLSWSLYGMVKKSVKASADARRNAPLTKRADNEEYYRVYTKPTALQSKNLTKGTSFITQENCGSPELHWTTWENVSRSYSLSSAAPNPWLVH